MQKNLKRIRLEASLTQKKLAEILGSNKNTISNVECGQSSVSLQFAERWANACGYQIQSSYDFIKTQ